MHTLKVVVVSWHTSPGEGNAYTQTCVRLLGNIQLGPQAQLRLAKDRTWQCAISAQHCEQHSSWSLRTCVTIYIRNNQPLSYIANDLSSFCYLDRVPFIPVSRLLLQVQSLENIIAMISAKRLVNMARKWQKMAAGKRKRISYKREDVDLYSSAANKGHFVVYSMDHKRFVVPLEYLKRNVFKELLKWSEEEFGLTSDGPLVLPCEGVALEYVISLVRERVPEEVEKVLITSMATCHGLASSSHAPAQAHQQTIIRGY